MGEILEIEQAKRQLARSDMRRDIAELREGLQALAVLVNQHQDMIMGIIAAMQAADDDEVAGNA